MTGMLVSLRSKNSRFWSHWGCLGRKGNSFDKKGRYTLGDKLQQQITSCVLEKFWENLCLCNRILSPQQVAQILTGLLRGFDCYFWTSIPVSFISRKIPLGSWRHRSSEKWSRVGGPKEIPLWKINVKRCIQPEMAEILNRS